MVLRLFRGGGDLGAVDLETDPASISPETPDLTLGQRNLLFAQWISDQTHASLREAAADIPKLMGLSMGRPRLSEQIRRHRSLDSERLGTLIDMEIEWASSQLVHAVPAESLELFAQSHGPVKASDVAARTYLLSRRLRAFGNRTLARTLAASRINALDPLTPLAPIGPLRLQTERAIKDLADPGVFRRLLDEHALPRVPVEERASGLGEMLMQPLLELDLVPRLLGTFLRPHQPIFVVAFEHPATSRRARAELAQALIGALELISSLGSGAFAEPPLGIDLWHVRDGRLRRSLGWRELGDPDSNNQFMRESIVAFVEAPDADLPLEAVGNSYDARVRDAGPGPTPRAGLSRMEEIVTDHSDWTAAVKAVERAALQDSVRAGVDLADEIAASSSPEPRASLEISRLGRGVGQASGLIPAPDESLTHIHRLLEGQGLAHLLGGSNDPDRDRLVEHYRQLFRSGLGMLLARILVGTYEDDDGEVGEEGYRILASAGLGPPRWEDSSWDADLDDDLDGNDDEFDFDAASITSHAAWDGRCACGRQISADEWMEGSEEALLICHTCGYLLTSHDDPAGAGRIITFVPPKEPM